MPGGGRAFVCAAGVSGSLGVWGELLRGRLLQHSGASSSQAAAGSFGGFGSDGLRARHERAEAVLDVLLQRSFTACADAGSVCTAAHSFCRRARGSVASRAVRKLFENFTIR